MRRFRPNGHGSRSYDRMMREAERQHIPNSEDEHGRVWMIDGYTLVEAGITSVEPVGKGNHIAAGGPALTVTLLKLNQDGTTREPYSEHLQKARYRRSAL